MGYNKSTLPAIALLLLLAVCFFGGCSVKNNTAPSRFYHNLTTRYNVYHNGDLAFRDAYKKQLESFSENLSERISVEPFSKEAFASKNSRGGSFDPAIEKGQKAIRLHSIRTKPTVSNRRQRNEPFYKKREYNTFIHNAWILVGKAQYYNGDFLDAMATFSYMARLYRDQEPIRNIAKLWQARCYLALGWTSDAEALLTPMQGQKETLPANLYGKCCAEWALAKGNLKEAIPALSLAISREEDSSTKTRLLFLKGQLEAEVDHRQKARKTFKKVIARAPSFSMEVASQLNIIALEAKENPRKALQQLETLTKKSRYSTLLDRIALLKGKLHLIQKDTTEAIKTFAFGLENSKEKSYDYTLCGIELAQLYLTKSDFVKAGKALSQAITALKESYPSYTQLRLLSSQLDELSRHAVVVETQDSLRNLVRLPEEQRLKIIDSAIVAYKKRVKEEGREQQLAEQRERQNAFNQEVGNDRPMQPSLVPSIPVNDKSFYFYNKELLALGKATFVKKWGQRSLEDDWRRKNKRVQIVSSNNLSQPSSNTLPIDSIDASKKQQEESSKEKGSKELDDTQNPEKRAYYLAQLPFTPEALLASDKLIQVALEGMGSLLNDPMERLDDAIKVYKNLLSRYPHYEKRREVYYKLFMLAERIGNKEEATYWRNKIISDFPQTPLAKEVTNPGYIESLRQQDRFENSLYEKALDAYFKGNIESADKLSKELLTRYSFSSLHPKALFLQALIKVATGDEKSLKQNLQKIIDLSPNSDVAEVAEPILKELSRGRKIVKEGYNEFDFSALFSSSQDSLAEDSLIWHSPKVSDTYSLLLLFPHHSLEINPLLFAITGFNFARFTDYNLSISLREGDLYDLLLIEEFPNSSIVRDYLSLAFSPKGFISLLDKKAILFPISKLNYELLMKGLPIDDYFNFLAESLSSLIPEVALPLEVIESLIHTEGKKKEKISPQRENISKNKTSSFINRTNTEGEHTQHPSDSLAIKPSLDSLPKFPSDTIQLPLKDSLSLPPVDTLNMQDKTKETKQDITEPTLTPGSMTFEDAKKQRQERLALEKKRKEAEKLKREEAERTKRELLKQREQARRKREKARREEKEKREKARRLAEKQRLEKRREAQRKKAKGR